MPTLCPVALAIGCRRCPIFTICPVKTLIGDQAPAAPEPTAKPAPRGRANAKPAKAKKAKRARLR